ncbi:MAG: carbohydrate ABC transporter permease [Spirochaetales bacterium]
MKQLKPKLRNVNPVRTDWRESASAYLMILPAAFVLFTFQYLPALDVFQISLTDRLLLRPVSNFIGLENYERLLEDGRFWNAVWNTVYFVAASVPIQIVLAVLLALSVAGAVRYRAFFRTVFFLPVAGSLVALSVIWNWIYHPRLGALNSILGSIGVPRIDWLGDSMFAMPAIVILVTWTGTGYYMVIYLAGLLDIPNQYYDAAKIDGANSWQRFWRITRPLLTPTTYLVLVLQVINSFQVFTTVFVMTGGGPSRSTEVLVYYLYTRAFESTEFGYASAVSVVMFVSLLAMALLIRWLYGGRVVYDR